MSLSPAEVFSLILLAILVIYLFWRWVETKEDERFQRTVDNICADPDCREAFNRACAQCPKEQSDDTHHP